MTFIAKGKETLSKVKEHEPSQDTVRTIHQFIQVSEYSSSASPLLSHPPN